MAIKYFVEKGVARGTQGRVRGKRRIIVLAVTILYIAFLALWADAGLRQLVGLK